MPLMQMRPAGAGRATVVTVEDTSKTGAENEVEICWELWLLEVADFAESFTVEIDLKYRWVPRGFEEAYINARSPAKGTGAYQELIDKCWDPEIAVFNAITAVETVATHTFLDDTTKKMHRFRKLRCTCSENLDLLFFPFDRQWLSLTIGTYRSISDVVFVPYKDRVCGNHSRATRWSLMHAADPMLVIPEVMSRGLYQSSKKYFHKCFIAIEAERDFWWYVIHFILPHAVILMMNANIVVIPRNSVGERNGVTLTLLLTTVAFQFLLVPEVPKKRYLTVLDMVMNLGLVVQLISCLVVFLNADLPSREAEVRVHFYEVTDEQAERVETLFFYWVIGTWVAANIGLVLFVSVMELLKSIKFLQPYLSVLHELSPAHQDWILMALGFQREANNSAHLKPDAVGRYAMHRMGQTRETTQATVTWNALLTSPQTVFSAPTREAVSPLFPAA